MSHLSNELPAYSLLGFDLHMDMDEETRLLGHYNKSQSLSDQELILPSMQSAEPIYYVESILNRGLQVPTKCEYTTSGFEYPSVLSHCGVSKQQWNQFTKEIIQEARLSRRQWTTTVAKGLGTFAIGGLMVGFLSVFPAMLIVRKARRNREEQNLLAAASGIASSELSRKVELWNETFFSSEAL